MSQRMCTLRALLFERGANRERLLVRLTNGFLRSFWFNVSRSWKISVLSPATNEVETRWCTSSGISLQLPLDRGQANNFKISKHPIQNLAICSVARYLVVVILLGILLGVYAGTIDRSFLPSITFTLGFDDRGALELDPIPSNTHGITEVVLVRYNSHSTLLRSSFSFRAGHRAWCWNIYVIAKLLSGALIDSPLVG